MRKEIIFFDGDGTIYFPRGSKRTINPKLHYKSGSSRLAQVRDLMVAPGAVPLLRRLRTNGVATVLVSTHPQPDRIARAILEQKMRHLKLIDLFDEYHAAADRPGGKGEVILRVLHERRIPKRRALMIGDSYRYDYLAAKRVGVDAMMMETPYMKHPARGPRLKNKIVRLSQLSKMLGEVDGRRK